MKILDPEKIWQMPKNKLISLIESGVFHNETGSIKFYAPSFIHYKNKYFRSSHDFFPSISITGSSCALKCQHCNGKVLDAMASTMTPESLYKLCLKLKNNGAAGCLISGGCQPDGSVPLDNFIDVMAKIKRDLGIIVIVHSGIIQLSTAKRLKAAGIDAVLIDFIGSNETIREIYHLDLTVEDYERSLKVIQESKIPFVPHLLVGLHYGELKGELAALKIIARYSPSAVIIIALMPIHGTHMEKVNPPEPEDIARILLIAKLLMPQTPIVLGCMRPKANHRIKTDLFAVKIGVDAIAFPVEEAIQLSESMPLKISFSSLCCSQIFKEITP